MLFATTAEEMELPRSPPRTHEHELVLSLSAAGSASLCFLQSQGSRWLHCQNEQPGWGRARAQPSAAGYNQTPSMPLTQTTECPVPRKQPLDKGKTNLLSPNPKWRECRLS